MERSCLSDFELEEAEYLRKKREREKRALEEDLDESQAGFHTEGRGGSALGSLSSLPPRV